MHHHFQPLCHAVRADVAGHELVAESECLADAATVRRGRNAASIDPVGHHADFFWRYAARDQAVANTAADGNHACGAAIEVVLKPLQCSDE